MRATFTISGSRVGDVFCPAVCFKLNTWFHFWGWKTSLELGPEMCRLSAFLSRCGPIIICAVSSFPAASRVTMKAREDLQFSINR